MFSPDEFVLKNRIVALIIALNILLCRFIDADVHTDTKIADLIIMVAIISTVMTA